MDRTAPAVPRKSPEKPPSSPLQPYATPLAKREQPHSIKILPTSYVIIKFTLDFIIVLLPFYYVSNIEIYNVELERLFNDEDIFVIQETWKNSRRLVSRSNGPAISTMNEETGEILSYEYRVDDILHRKDGPAIMQKSGGHIFESWWTNGNQNRNDGPAETVTSGKTGVIISEEWYLSSRLHRYGGAAVIFRDEETGEVTGTEYWEHGKKADESPIPPPDPVP